MEGCIVKAVYDFPKEAESDLALTVGDIVKVTKEVNEEWCLGETYHDAGQFPISFVDVLLKNAPSRVFKAVADFEGQEDGDIKFKCGEIIGLKEEIDENWIIGVTNSSSGLCPKSFVQEILFNKVDQKIPNLLNVSHDESHTETAYGESIDDFSAQGNDEISFPKGVKIELIKEVDSFWTEGAFNGSKGKFPSLFVKVIVPLPPELQFKDCNNDKVELDQTKAEPKAKALFLYIGANADELSFDKGDIITLLERVGDQWYKGKIGKSVGLFPANHVEVIVDLPYGENADWKKGSNHLDDTRASDKKKETNLDPSVILNKEEITKKPKPMVSKQKPSLKPKPVQQKATESKQGNRSKPILLTSLKEKQKSNTKEEGYLKKNVNPGSQNEKKQNAPPKPKIPFESQKQQQISDPAIEYEAQKNEVLNNNAVDISKQADAPIIIKSKKNKQMKPPQRPPAKSSFDKSVPGSNFDSKVEPKTKPAVAERPKPKPQAKGLSLENDMPLLNTGKRALRKEQSSAPSANMMSANVNLLAQELSSLGLDENSNSKNVSNSVFYAENSDKNGTGNTEATQVAKRTKRPAPKRPDKHPSRVSVFSANVTKPLIDRSPTSSPNLTAKGSIEASPSASPKASKEKWGQNTVNSGKAKTLPPKLPKPLAPQPPKKPPVSPNNRKSDTVDGVQTLQQPSFQAYQSLEGIPFSGANGTSNGIQDNKSKEARASMFYVDFLGLDSVDGEGENAHQEIETVEKKIVQIKGQIETESSMLSGIETLLEFSQDEEKKSELRFRQRSLSTSLMSLNEELDAYQDEKSYLMASFGDLSAIRERIVDLSQQIESYKDNSAKLRRMKDVATIDELAEIRDGIEFCENMVETLTEEMKSLEQKADKIEAEEQKPQKEDPEEIRRKLLSQREKAVTELIKTERDYLRDIDLCAMKILPKLSGSKVIDCEKVFGNLPEICTVSKRLLDSLESLDDGNQSRLGEQIGRCFADISFDLKQEYSSYCRNYDESQILLEKLEQDAEVRDEIFTVVTTLRDETGLWDLSSYLIKPVQRILKYPLILQEIYKFSPEDDPDRESIQEAIRILRNVATAINEFKRRKDLVQKYQRTEGIGNKIQRLNWHSVRKKSSRINQKITQFTGLVSQTVDETFIEEEKRFRATEKLIKNFIRSLGLFLEDFQETTNFQRIMADSIKTLCAEAPIQDEVASFYNVITKLKDAICPKFVFVVRTRVFDPLERLLQLFQSPLKLIEKREDKCLDYDRMLNRVQKNKDADKTKQVNDELKMAKNNYDALNSQLLEELPRLSVKCLRFFRFCLANFVKARLRYYTEVTAELRLVLQFHLIERHSSTEIVQKHAESLVAAAERISQLLFYPERITTYDGQAKQEPLILSRETFSNFYVDMLFEPIENDPTSPIKPTASQFDSKDGSESRPIPLPRRKSLRRSSSGQSPTKSPGFLSNGNTSPTRRVRIHSLEETVQDLYIAEYTFEREDAAEISMEEGNVVHVIRKHDKELNPEWWLVETASGRGYVPASYLSLYKDNETVVNDFGNQNGRTERSVPINVISSREQIENSFNEANISYKHKEASGNSKTSQSSIINSLTTDMNGHTSGDQSVVAEELTKKVYYRAVYDFEATEKEELSFAEGDIVTVLRTGDDSGNEEWCFVEIKGKFGYVPFNYLHPLNGCLN